MPLALKTVPPARGAAWVREAWRLFGRRPLGFTGLFLVFLFVAMVTMFVPLLGAVLQMMLLPMLSLGFMVAAAAALQGAPVQPGHFIEPLTRDVRQRAALLTLCAVYGVLAITLLWFSNWVADGKLAELQMALGSGQAAPQEVDELTADRGVFVGTLVLLLGATALSIPFWHAPALVHWGRQGVAQALFSSTLAVWRAKGAFLVYGLTWFVTIAGFGLATALVLGLAGLPQLAGVMALPAGLMFSTVFYVSLLFSFRDSFGEAIIGRADDDVADPPPSEPNE